MAARTAEEAGLSDGDNDRSTQRARTEKTANTANPDPPPSDSPQGDGLDMLTYLPTPPPDPLDIHSWDKLSIFENVHPAQIAKWNAITEAKLLVYKAYGGRIEGKEDVTEIQNLIRSTLELSSDPTIAVPSSLENLSRRDPPHTAHSSRTSPPREPKDSSRKDTSPRRT